MKKKQQPQGENMFKHPAVQSQKLIREMDKQGNMKTILQVTTDAPCEPNSALETSVADALVEYIRDREIDAARIN